MIVLKQAGIYGTIKFRLLITNLTIAYYKKVFPTAKKGKLGIKCITYRLIYEGLIFQLMSDSPEGYAFAYKPAGVCAYLPFAASRDW